MKIDTIPKTQELSIDTRPDVTHVNDYSLVARYSMCNLSTIGLRTAQGSTEGNITFEYGDEAKDKRWMHIAFGAVTEQVEEDTVKLGYLKEEAYCQAQLEYAQTVLAGEGSRPSEYIRVNGDFLDKDYSIKMLEAISGDEEKPDGRWPIQVVVKGEGEDRFENPLENHDRYSEHTVSMLFYPKEIQGLMGGLARTELAHRSESSLETGLAIIDEMSDSVAANGFISVMTRLINATNDAEIDAIRQEVTEQLHEYQSDEAKQQQLRGLSSSFPMHSLFDKCNQAVDFINDRLEDQQQVEKQGLEESMLQGVFRVAGKVRAELIKKGMLQLEPEVDIEAGTEPEDRIGSVAMDGFSTKVENPWL